MKEEKRHIQIYKISNNFASHATFLKKLFKDVLQDTGGAGAQERGSRHCKETKGLLGRMAEEIPG